MKEADLCRLSGCEGLCCRDRSMVVHREVREQIFPMAVEITRTELSRIDNSTENGVYYSPYSSSAINEIEELVIKGLCPNYSGGCTKREDRPLACIRFKRGREDCDELRSDNGLGIVPLNWWE